MVLNLPAFYRHLVSYIRDEKDRPVFDYYELDQIVEAAMSRSIPLITAKKWAISDSKKGEVHHGKNQDE